MKKMTKVMAAVMMGTIMAGFTSMTMSASAAQKLTAPNAYNTVRSTTQTANKKSTADITWFAKGVYEVSIDGVNQSTYFVFTDKSNGRTENRYGTGIGFTCEQSVQGVNFHFGGVDDETFMRVDSAANNTIKGSIYGHTYTCKLMNGVNADTFDAETYTSKSAKKPASSKKTQNPVRNYVGTYSYGRATLEVAAMGSDQASITVYWSSSAFEHSEWTMSGKVTVKNGAVYIKYNDCIKHTIVYDVTGELESDTVDYAFGSGMVMVCDNYANWYDAQENAAIDSTFVYAN